MYLQTKLSKDCKSDSACPARNHQKLILTKSFSEHFIVPLALGATVTAGLKEHSQREGGSITPLQALVG
jgi:positive regulator of sigma E activity